MRKQTKTPPESKPYGRFSFLMKSAYLTAIFSTAASVAILLSLTLFDVADDALALTHRDTEKHTVTVSELSELPSELHKAGVIKHPRLFSLYISSNDKPLERQTASVSDDMDYRALLSAFTNKPPTETVRISIPKGSCVADVIEIFVSRGIGTRQGFAEVINSYPFEYSFIDAIPESPHRLYRLEGYLYPDTYDFYTGRSESYYIDKLLARFEQVTAGLAPLCEKAGLTLDEALTVASLIERSAGFSSSYERMSAVIHNRLDGNLCLEIPASSVYGLYAVGGLYVGQATEELTSADSPYNTFINKGLPPGAICSPTKEAILCAIYPEESRYMYFVTRKNGSVAFAKTIREHRENLASG